MRLSLLLTARCNAGCAHCSTNCGPYRTESLDTGTLFAVMDQAKRLAGRRRPEFYLSGGEPFLDFPRLLAVIRHGARLRGVVTCVTNGYWATSDDKARAMLAAVRAAGLQRLAVSRSRFHEAFVSRRRVERVLGAARAVRLPCTVKYVRGRSDADAPAEVARWARAAGADNVQEIRLLPHLREGARLPESEYPRRRGLPRGACPARLFSVREDGRAFTCCTPGGFNDLLALGNVRETPLAELRDRFHLGGTQQILRRHGPIHFARAVRGRGLGDRLRGAYAGVCDLCTHIASDPQMAAVAADVSGAFEIRQVTDLLGSRAAGVPHRPKGL